MSYGLICCSQAWLCPSQLFYWRRRIKEGTLTGVACEEKVVPESELKKAHDRIRRLENILGRKTEEVEVLKEAVRLGREKTHLACTLARRGGFRMSIIAQALDVSRSNLYDQVKKSTARKRKTGDDSADLSLIRQVTDERPSYGYRRVTAILKHREKRQKILTI